jgi:hypothetical protein
MALKIAFYKMIVAQGLIKDIKGYKIQFWSSSNSSIEEKNDGYILVVSPVIVPKMDYPI